MTEEGYLEYEDLVEGMRIETMNTSVNPDLFAKGVVVRFDGRLVFRFDDYSYIDKEDSHEALTFFKLVQLKSTRRGICDFINRIEKEYP